MQELHHSFARGEMNGHPEKSIEIEVLSSRFRQNSRYLQQEMDETAASK